MALRPQQVGAVVALGAAICVLVLVCVGALIAGRDASSGGSDGARSASGGTDAPAVEHEEDGTRIDSYSSERGTTEEAADLLDSYASRGSCVLREAGFIDLFGNAWTCTVQGPGWVDVCLVSGSASEAGTSDVRVIHMDVGEWERAYGQASG